MSIKKMINKFCAPFGVTARKGKEWKANVDEYIIYFPRDKERYTSPGYMECIHALYPDIEVSEFIFSILHEVGHCMTWDRFLPQQWEELCYKGASIVNIYEYYKLPHEKEANDWAVEYIRNHSKRIAKWDKRFKKKGLIF